MKSVVCIIIQEKNNTTKMWLKLATPCTAAQVTYYSITLTMVQMFPIQFYICQKTWYKILLFNSFKTENHIRLFRHYQHDPCCVKHLIHSLCPFVISFQDHLTYCSLCWNYLKVHHKCICLSLNIWTQWTDPTRIFLFIYKICIDMKWQAASEWQWLGKTMTQQMEKKSICTTHWIVWSSHKKCIRQVAV